MTKTLDDFINLHLEQLFKCPNKSAELMALEAILQDDFNFQASVALSTQLSDQNTPLLRSVSSIRAIYQNAELIKLNNKTADEIRDSIDQKVNDRIEFLHNQNISSSLAPAVNAANIVTFLSFTSAYLCESAMRTANSVIHSNNKTIRWAIDYGIKAAMASFINKTYVDPLTVTIATVSGAVGGTISSTAELLAPKYVGIINAATDGAITALVSNAGKNINLAVGSAAVAAIAGATAKLVSNDSDAPGIAIAAAVAGFNNNSAVDALYATVQKNFYNMGWKATKAQVTLDRREFREFINSYCLATYLGKFNKTIAVETSKHILEQIDGYLNRCTINAKTIEESNLISSALKAIDNNSSKQLGAALGAAVIANKLRRHFFPIENNKPPIDTKKSEVIQIKKISNRPV